ncbi:MAG: GCN5 family acetyltransferase [Gordonia sp. (in: high G+C Gram-positive bacteria)]|uniref:GNAT family N-acetyltransferase, cg3035/Rv0428c family n=1 Tax=Gordonia sp. (in: high G+C Gram-positive bacteria) TaxID=84139 RepID=UPI0039E5FCD5
MDPLPGDRVVVRYRLGAGGPDDWREAPNPALAHTPTLSDLTGFLVERGPDGLVVERDGRIETVPAEAITSLRTLSARTVRNAQIRAVERVLTDAVPAAERAEIDGWTLSATPGAQDPRACAAVPIEFGAAAAALDRIAAWYAERGLPGRVVVADRLLRTADLPAPATAEHEVLVGPDGDPVELAGDDLPARTRWRERGYRLHHTVAVVDLPTARTDSPGGDRLHRPDRLR